jgi:lipopolysaccharide/colanic/teichoic acid biosynthesis glycosyltransferase
MGKPPALKTNPALALVPRKKRVWFPVGLVRRSYFDAKRIIDSGAALLILILSLPVIFICAILIKTTSKGPVFYKQQRVGMNGRLFDIIKLRTMRTNAEEDTGPVWAKDNDPRVTAIGRFLRKSHLDELPQLINVLKGDMSLVGPRPERTIFVNEFNQAIAQYYKRLSVKPGITGLAQVRYKYDETIADVRRKLAYDLLYIRKMCWYMDLTIVLLTVGKLLDRGAK